MLGIRSIIIEFCHGVQTPLLKRRSEKQMAGGIFWRAKEHSWKFLRKRSRLVERDPIREVGTVPSDVI